MKRIIIRQGPVRSGGSGGPGWTMWVLAGRWSKMGTNPDRTLMLTGNSLDPLGSFGNSG